MKTFIFNGGALILFAASYVATWYHKPWIAILCVLASLPLYRLADKST